MPQFSLLGGPPPALAPEAVFFALRPEPLAAMAIAQFGQDLCRAYGLHGVPHRADRLHVSLYRIGTGGGVSPSVLARAVEAGAAAAAAMPPFVVEFNRIASFRGGRDKRPLVLLGDDGTVGVTMLQQKLGRA